MLALTVTLALLASPDDPEAIVVRCKTEALIRGTEVLMRDIATIECADAALTSRIGDIRIAGRPALGFNRVFPAADIRRRLVAAGLRPEQIEMSGASEVVAQPLATALNPSDITGICDPVLRAVLELDGEDVEFELQTDLPPLRVPPGRWDLALRAKLRDGRVQATSATIDFEVWVDDELFKSVPLVYRLRHFVEALEPTRVIKRGEPINETNVALRRVEVSPGSNMHLTSFDLVRGMVAARDIQNNRLLRLADVAKPAVVHRNDLVTLIAQRGRIQVSTKAIALDDGPVGGRVMVRSLSTAKPVQAVVYAAGIVVIAN